MALQGEHRNDQRAERKAGRYRKTKRRRKRGLGELELALCFRDSQRGHWLSTKAPLEPKISFWWPKQSVTTTRKEGVCRGLRQDPVGAKGEGKWHRMAKLCFRAALSLGGPLYEVKFSLCAVLKQSPTPIGTAIRQQMISIHFSIAAFPVAEARGVFTYRQLRTRFESQLLRKATIRHPGRRPFEKHAIRSGGTTSS